MQLEWSMKLWWVHCEALVAALMAYSVTRDHKHWVLFRQAFDYVASHVRYHGYIWLLSIIFNFSFQIRNMGNGMGI